MHSHQEFTDECATSNLTPRGLRVKVRCNALLPTYSNVRETFKSTSELAERGFKANLTSHYRTKLEKELAEIERSMSTTLTQATPQEKQTRKELQKTTKEPLKRTYSRVSERIRPKNWSISRPNLRTPHHTPAEERRKRNRKGQTTSDHQRDPLPTRTTRRNDRTDHRENGGEVGPPCLTVPPVRAPIGDAPMAPLVLVPIPRIFDTTPKAVNKHSYYDNITIHNQSHYNSNYKRFHKSCKKSYNNVVDLI